MLQFLTRTVDFGASVTRQLYSLFIGRGQASCLTTVTNSSVVPSGKIQAWMMRGCVTGRQIGLFPQNILADTRELGNNHLLNWR